LPSRAEQLEQARRNRDLASDLLATRVGDPTARQWIVTLAFYCALHCLEAHLDTHGRHCFTHSTRNRTLAQPAIGVPPDVFVAYRQLQIWSEGARYSLQEFDETRIRTQVIGGYLARVTRFINI
jgi:hypothetical protein